MLTRKELIDVICDNLREGILYCESGQLNDFEGMMAVFNTVVVGGMHNAIRIKPYNYLKYIHIVETNMNLTKDTDEELYNLYKWCYIKLKSKTNSDELNAIQSRRVARYAEKLVLLNAEPYFMTLFFVPYGLLKQYRATLYTIRNESVSFRNMLLYVMYYCVNLDFIFTSFDDVNIIRKYLRVGPEKVRSADITQSIVYEVGKDLINKLEVEKANGTA